MGAVEKNLIAQCKRFKEPLPDRIRDKPRLGIGLEIFLDAFFELEHDRLWLVGSVAQPLPIPWYVIHSYIQAHGYTGVLAEDMLHFVRELDAVYVAHIRTKGG